MTYDDDAFELIKKTRNEIRDAYKTMPETHRAIRSRKIQLAMRIAVIHCCSLAAKNRKEPKSIGLESVQWALEFVEYCQQVSMHLVDTCCADSVFGSDQTTVLNVILESHGIKTRKQLSKRLNRRFKSDYLSELLKSLVEAERIGYVPITREGIGRDYSTQVYYDPAKFNASKLEKRFRGKSTDEIEKTLTRRN